MRSGKDVSQTMIGAPRRDDASARTVIIPRGCNGPPESGQGGWKAGLIAEQVGFPLVWAAMDCPTASAFALSKEPEPVGVVLLANLALDIKALPVFGDRCVITAWPLGRAGRKRFSAGALLSADGAVLATAEALWIEPRSH